MITGWFARFVLGFVLLGLALFEVGSPFIVRVQLDGTAVTAAQEARLEYERSTNVDNAKRVAGEKLAEGHAVLEGFAIDAEGGVSLTAYRRAKSFVIYRIQRFASFYDVRSPAKSKKS